MARITRLLLAFMLMAVLVGSTAGSASARSAAGPAVGAPLASACCGDGEDPPSEPVLLSASSVTLQPGQLACTNFFYVANGVRIIGSVTPQGTPQRRAKLTVRDLIDNVFFFQRVIDNFDITVYLLDGYYRACIRNPAASGTSMVVNAVAYPF